jgi:hypothetical protein
MSRKRKKPTEPVTPAWTLPQIEEDAVRDGCEILFGPQRVRLVSTVVECAPYPEAGPGRWRNGRSSPRRRALRDRA